VFDYYRTPQQGKDPQPAYATRCLVAQPVRTAAAGGGWRYYGRQSYGFDRTWWLGGNDGLDCRWATSFSLSGKFYRGKGLAGLAAHRTQCIF